MIGNRVSYRQLNNDRGGTATVGMPGPSRPQRIFVGFPRARLRTTCHMGLGLKIVLLSLMACMGLLPLVPDELDVIAACFAVLFGVFMLASAAFFSPQPLRGSNSILTCFFAMIVISGPVAYFSDTSLANWFRGALPFTFLSTYFVCERLGNSSDRLLLARGVVVASLVWAAKILITALPEMGGLLSGDAGRLCYYNLDALLPFSIAAFPLLLFIPEVLPRVLRFAAIAVFLLIIIVSMYTSQITIVVALLAIYMGRQRQFRTLLPAAFVLGLLLLSTGAAMLSDVFSTDLSEAVLSRFVKHQDRGLVDRGDELQYAESQFLSSPVVGVGLGKQIPLGAVDSREQNVGYIHNLWAYLLMDMGLLGFAPYAVFFGYAIWQGIKSRQSELACPQLCFGAAMAIASLLIFFTCQASFRSIQSNVMLAVLAALARPGADAGSARGS